MPEINLSEGNFDVVSGPSRPPRMTTVQRDALSAKTGMTVWNTTDNTLQVYDGTSWENVPGGGTAVDDENAILASQVFGQG